MTLFEHPLSLMHKNFFTIINQTIRDNSTVLTRRQHELLSFLIHYQKRHGISPSYDEMREGMALRSKSTVHSLVEALKKKGYCKLSPHAARTIEVLKTPDQDQEVFDAYEKQIESTNSPTLPSIPLFGSLPSSISLNFLEDSQSAFSLNRVLFPEGDLFALTLQGDFLKEFALLNEDILILKKTNTGHHGGLFLVSVDHELMLRRFEVEGTRILLKTSNKYMIPRAHEEKEICVHGEVVGLLRTKGF